MTWHLTVVLAADLVTVPYRNRLLGGIVTNTNTNTRPESGGTHVKWTITSGGAIPGSR